MDAKELELKISGGGAMPFCRSLNLFSRRNFWKMVFSRSRKALAALTTSSWKWTNARNSSKKDRASFLSRSGRSRSTFSMSSPPGGAPFFRLPVFSS